MGKVVRIGSKVAHAAGWRLRGARDWGARALEIARVTRRDHGVGAVALGARTARVVRGHGYTLDEAFTMGALDPSVDDTVLDDLVSKRDTIGLQARLNPNELSHLTEDKAVFYRVAEGLGLPVPRLHAILCQSGPGWARGGHVLAGPEDWARYLVDEAPDEFVLKPTRGYHGLGVRLVTRRPDGVFDVAGHGPTTVTELCRAVVDDRQFHVHVVQERLRDHPDLPGDGATLQTLRIITFVGRDGSVEVVNGQFRMIRPGNTVDNFANGTTGNVLAIVDLDDGTLGTVLRAGAHRSYEMVAPGEIEWCPPPGTRLPHWDGIVSAVSAAALQFLPMRSIGWDVAVTPDGPRIVEANIWWDSPSPQPGIGAIVERMRTA